MELLPSGLQRDSASVIVPLLSQHSVNPQFSDLELVEQMARELRVHSVSLPHLHLLRTALTLQGQFRAASIVRRSIRATVCETPTDPKHRLACELDRLGSIALPVESVMPRMPLAIGPELTTELVEAYSPLSRLSRLVSGDSIALVGSAHLSNSIEAELSSFDHVIRLKFFAGEESWSRRNSGPRCDISFYNKHMTRAIANSSPTTQPYLTETLRTLKLMVFRNSVPPQAARIGIVSRNKPVLISGSAQLGILALVELLICRPRSITLYGFDFYDSDHPHDLDSVTQKKQRAGGRPPFGRDWYRRSFALHDMHSQVNLVRALTHSGVIGVSPAVRRVLERSELQYARRLEERFAPQEG